MPEERGYETRIAPKAGTPLPEASNAGLIQLGRTIEAIGGQIHQNRLRSYELDRKETAATEGAAFLHEFALARQNWDDIEREMRNSADPGGQGHTERVRQVIEAQRDALLSKITDSEVHRRATQQFEAVQGNYIERAGAWQEGQRVAKSVADYQQASDVSNNLVMTSRDPAVYQREAALGEAGLGQVYAPPDVIDKLRRAGNSGRDVAFLTGQINDQPDKVVQSIDAGDWNRNLDAQQLTALRNNALTEIRRRQAQAEHESALNKAAVNNKIGELGQKVSDGVDVAAEAQELLPLIDPAELDQIARVRGWIYDSKFAQAYSAAPPAAVDAAIGRITQIPQDKRSEDQQRELHWLETVGRSKSAQFFTDTVGWAQRNGSPAMQPPSLENGLTDRGAWWKNFRAANGAGVKPLSNAEAVQMQQRMAEGQAGYDEVANAIGTQANNEDYAQALAKQVAPNDAFFQHAVVMAPQFRKQALDGRAFLAKDRALIVPDNERDKTLIRQQSFKFDRMLQTLGPQAVGTRNVAEAMAAYEVHRTGKVMDAEIWNKALNGALEAVGQGKDQKGGIGHWNDDWYLVPQGLTNRQFMDQVFRHVRDNPKTRPVNPDGSAAMLQNAYPVAVGRNVYRFKVGERWVSQQGKDGKPNGVPWTFTARPGR